MKRQNRFFVALLSAGLTFGLLFTVLGNDHWQYRRHYGYHHHHHDCDDHKTEGTKDEVLPESE